MLNEFDQYVINQGFRRIRRDYEHKKWIDTDSDSYYVSTYGPIDYWFTNGKDSFYWGLCEAGFGPYYHDKYDRYYVLTGNHKEDLHNLINEINTDYRNRIIIKTE